MRLTVFCLSLVVAHVAGHGYLMDPPGRASAWRYGFDTPPDYNDNECFCGGFAYQYEVNDGKCGICGDAWDDEPPRMHEAGSIYATGTLVRNYTQGQAITAVANVTANHLGHFEYKICANNNVSAEATQECLDLTPLYEAGSAGDDYFLYIGDTIGAISFDLQLPADLVCTQCVFQWRYVAGNTWGTCANGTEAVGCGPQEEFRGCADVSISPAVELLETEEVKDSMNVVETEVEEVKYSANVVETEVEEVNDSANVVETEIETEEVKDAENVIETEIETEEVKDAENVVETEIETEVKDAENVIETEIETEEVKDVKNVVENEVETQKELSGNKVEKVFNAITEERKVKEESVDDNEAQEKNSDEEETDEHEEKKLKKDKKKHEESDDDSDSDDDDDD